MYEKEFKELMIRRQDMRLASYANLTKDQKVAFETELEEWLCEYAELKRRADCGVYDVSALGVGAL